MTSILNRFILYPWLTTALAFHQRRQFQEWRHASSLGPSTLRRIPSILDDRSFFLRSHSKKTEGYPTSGPSAVLSQVPLQSETSELQMLSFYHFEPVGDPLTCRDDLFEALKSIPGLRGTIYLAQEGINAQLAVPTGSPLSTLLEVLASQQYLPFDPFVKLAPNLGKVVPADTPTFQRFIVRLRDFVLRDGIPETIELDWTDAGKELSPEEWHQDLQKVQSSSTEPPVILDCRNYYETVEGTFKGAVPLDTDIFQESWEPLQQLTKDLPKDEAVHIFCTGGIRCVKVGAYLKQHLGFSNVKRLEHGIIGYEEWLEEQDESTGSTWEGENFLFDKRRYAEGEGEEKDSQSGP